MSTHFFGLKERAFSYSHSVGRNEFAGTGLRNPVDMAIGAGDTAYIINRSYENRPDGVRMSVITLDEEYISEFASAGEGDGQFVWPTAVALDAQGKVYVSDEWLKPDIDFRQRRGVLKQLGQSWAPGMANWTARQAWPSVATAPSSSPIAATTGVQKFSSDGTYIGKFGSAGDGPGQFNLPWGIDVSQDGTVSVADWRNDRIQQFSSNGEWLASIGQVRHRHRPIQPSQQRLRRRRRGHLRGRLAEQPIASAGPRWPLCSPNAG